MNGAQDTIIALATAQGVGAIAVIRISGDDAIALADQHFKARSKTSLAEVPSHSIHLGDLYDKERIIDEVLVSVFRAPRSYTGENVVEIACHGSIFIQQQILNLFVATKACRVAQPGEFTFRAFKNGKMKLSEAEAVADLIASESAAEHRIAIEQMRGGFATSLSNIREQLLHFASMIELELDFSGEDVEFADYSSLKELLRTLKVTIKQLLDSFALGNVIKQGIPIAIIGAPNAGKSTLLNSLLNEERALVSDEAGTTRDTVEEFLTLNGIRFRLIDTAGIRNTSNHVEKMGIERSIERAQNAHLIVYVIDASAPNTEALALEPKILTPERTLIVLNKSDLSQNIDIPALNPYECIQVSAKEGQNIEALKERISTRVLEGASAGDATILTNSRHFQSLQAGLNEIYTLEEELEKGASQDLLAIPLRSIIHHLGEITGVVTNDDILGSIFSSFCIGK